MMVQSDWGGQSIPTRDVDRRKHCETYLWVSLLAEKSMVAVIAAKRRQAINIGRLNCSFTDSRIIDDEGTGRSG
jgi:hypothetical protein